MNETAVKLRRNATRSPKATEYSKPHPSGLWTLDAAQNVQWPILQAMCLWPMLHTTCLWHALHTACPGHMCRAPTGHHPSVRGQVMRMGAVKDGTCQGGLVGTSTRGSGGGSPCMGLCGSVHGVAWVHAGWSGLRAQVWAVRRPQEACGGLGQVGG